MVVKYKIRQNPNYLHKQEWKYRLVLFPFNLGSPEAPKSLQAGKNSSEKWEVDEVASEHPRLLAVATLNSLYLYVQLGIAKFKQRSKHFKRGSIVVGII
jgi:hypothetical protein